MDRRLLSRWVAVFVVAGISAWVALNGVSGFGYSRSGLTTYRALPIPYADLQLRPDGALRFVAKTHTPSRETLAWLLASRPEVVIIATGWQGKVDASALVHGVAGVDWRVLRTPEAISLFDRMRRRGVRVALHLHSTC